MEKPLMGYIARAAAFCNQLMAARAHRGPYRYLVKQWRRVNDIDLAVRVLATDYFTHELSPIELPLETVPSILVLAPHQDDEAIGAGGTLLLARKAGIRVGIVYVTDGAQTNKPNIARNPTEISDIRDHEAKDACERLGASIHRLGVSNLDLRATMGHVDALRRIIDETSPAVILAPWILDSPAKHRFVNHLLWLLLMRDGPLVPEIWGYQVHNALFPNGYVNYTEVADEKRSLIECFKSQVEHCSRYEHIALGMGAWNSRLIKSETPAFIETFFTLPADEFKDLVGRFYFSDIKATYRGRDDIIRGIANLHREVTSTDLAKERSPLLTAPLDMLAGVIRRKPTRRLINA